MGNTLANIRLNRVLLALMVTFLIVDTYPHPRLGPGLMESLVQQGLTSLTNEDMPRTAVTP